MRKFCTIILTVISLYSYQITNAQCTGVKGPNLLGAKGTFSSPAITINTHASNCSESGSSTYSPVGNVGDALTGCTAAIGNSIPCSDYTYTASKGGLQPEFTYSIVKTIGNSTGGNCLKGDWRGSEHTGDGGYFMVVNGAPNTTFSPVFYQIKHIPVCIGTTYEFSAWVLNVLPASSAAAITGSEPNLSFKVNGAVISNSGAIAYTNTPTWVKVGGSFIATTSFVDLQVVNATAVASGNDLGIDDISINVCQSQIAVNAPSSVTEGNSVTVNYVVTDPTQTNTWYKLQKSTNGGATFNDFGSAAQTTFTTNSFSLPLALGAVNATMNGYKYRLIVSPTQSGLTDPVCTYFNDFTLIVTSGGPLPIQLTSFTGSYSNGLATLNWQTSQELNSDHFELFRSYDGVDFTSVTKIKSAGTSNTIKNYSFQDHVSGGNHVYYRLKQVDNDGKETFSAIVNLSMGVSTGADIFPNPFKNSFTVTMTSTKTSFATLKIQNTAGQLVYSKNINLNKGNNSLVITNLPASLGSGIYYITIVNDEIKYNSKLQKL
ncbi:MAG: T9SS type A sorting domain-containing protein [Ferruginibacter sp.]